MHQNPAHVPTVERDVLWNNLVDVVDDYFRIEREDRVRLAGNVMTEGRIDTFWLGGATYLEPWRKDSVGRYNRLEATLRRRAFVRVIPVEGGYLVDVAVYKELLDARKPQFATAGAATFSSGESPPIYDRQLDESDDYALPQSKGWIPQGRDAALEQEILAKLYTKLGMPAVMPLPGAY